MHAYYRPSSLNDALEILGGENVMIAAGCTDLFPATERQELTGPVLDVTGIDELRGISKTATGWRIGATTTWSDLLAVPLPAAFDMLKQAAQEVGSVQIQNAGTIAGNLCNASPAADGVPPLLALDAEVELSGATGQRVMPLADFLTGPRTTQLGQTDLLTAVHVPETAGVGQSRFLKLGARRYLVISIAMVAVRLHIEADRVANLALAVGACSGVATRLSNLENKLVGSPAAELSGALKSGEIADCLSPISDVRGDAAYRREAAEQLLRRALSELVHSP